MKLHLIRQCLTLATLSLLSATAAPVPAAQAGLASDCTKTSVGFTPLSDLATGSYKGFQGGLYPGGQNVPPAAQLAAAMARAAAMQPLGVDGSPNAGGKIVLLSVGMSNATQEYQAFMGLARADVQMSRRVLLVDGAQGGQTASIVRDPAANYWKVLDQRLQQAGSSPAQVQVIWLKEANAGPTDPFPGHARTLQADLEATVGVAHDRFPNLKLIYFSSRTYGGYATTTLNPEPYAYETGFAVKWLIEKQIQGDATLNFDPAKGPVRAPVLLWGPYLWADGMTPRSDGLVWQCDDFVASDGTHPSDPAGRRKVGNLLLDFLKTNDTTKGWFLADPNVTPAPSSTHYPTATAHTPPPTTGTPTGMPGTPHPPTSTPTRMSYPTHVPTRTPADAHFWAYIPFLQNK